MTAVLSGQRQARTLVGTDLFDSLVRAILRDHSDIGQDRAERIADQALAFLGACARFPEKRLAPSKTVDIGWHAFILYTREYAEFCERVAGRFIHHVPQDAPGAPQHSKEPVSVRVDTVGAIREAGYWVDEQLWAEDAYSCGNCYDEGNCAASGKDGDENTGSRKPD